MGGSHTQEEYNYSIVKSANIVWRMQYETVILHNLDKDIKVTLNGVGADIWIHITSNNKTTINSIVQFVCNEYDVDATSDIYNDVKEYVNHLTYSFAIDHISSYQPSRVLNPIDISFKNKTLFTSRNKFNLEAVTLELTNKCNEKCIHCYVCDDNSELDFKECLGLIDQLNSLNVLYLSFTGGEPLLRNDFIQLYKYAHSSGFAIDLYTNATLISENHIQLFYSCKPRCIYISLYSMNSETHDKITRIDGSFKKTFKAITSLAHKKINIVLNVPIMTENHNDIIDIIKFANKKTIKFKLSFNITPKNNGDRSPVSLQCYDDNKLKSILKYINYSDNTSPNENDYVCGAGLTSITIDPSGNVKPCVGLPKKVGSIFEETIENIWKNSLILSNIRNIKWKDCKDCNQCDIKQHCNHCMGISYLETNDMRSKNKCDCYIAKLKNEYITNQDLHSKK